MTEPAPTSSTDLIDPTELAIDGLLEPFTARSLVASTLIGTHPPALPGRLLVALGERFGIGGGTTRVALSRMVERGELRNDDGVYALDGDLLARQERQDRSRSAAAAPWDGTWEQAVVSSSGRQARDRAQLRRALGALGLAELREGVWMRPANLDPARLPSARAVADAQVSWFRVAALDGAAAISLAGRLFELDRWADTATALGVAIGTARLDLGTGAASDADVGSDADAIVSGFTLASATLRHLIHDPQLPSPLLPPDWPADTLRGAYEDYERAYQQLLRAFFRSVR